MTKSIAELVEDERRSNLLAEPADDEQVQGDWPGADLEWLAETLEGCGKVTS